MDNKHEILQLLRGVAEGTVSPENALLKLKEEPFEDLGYAKVDLHRSVRQGAAEVIYGAGKTPEQIVAIMRELDAAGNPVLATRLKEEAIPVIRREIPEAEIHETARTALIPSHAAPARLAISPAARTAGSHLLFAGFTGSPSSFSR